MIKKTMHENFVHESCRFIQAKHTVTSVCHAVDLNRENALTTPPCE